MSVCSKHISGVTRINITKFSVGMTCAAESHYVVSGFVDTMFSIKVPILRVKQVGFNSVTQ